MWFAKEMKGRDLIDDVLGKFESMIDSLWKGIAECKEEMDANNSMMNNLQSENEQLSTAMGKAENVITNLNKLLGS